MGISTCCKVHFSECEDDETRTTLHPGTQRGLTGADSQARGQNCNSSAGPLPPASRRAAPALRKTRSLSPCSVSRAQCLRAQRPSLDHSE